MSALVVLRDLREQMDLQVHRGLLVRLGLRDCKEMLVQLVLRGLRE